MTGVVDFLQAVALVDVRDGIASLCQFSRLFGHQVTGQVVAEAGGTRGRMGHGRTPAEFVVDRDCLMALGVGHTHRPVDAVVGIQGGYFSVRTGELAGPDGQATTVGKRGLLAVFGIGHGCFQ